MAWWLIWSWFAVVLAAPREPPVLGKMKYYVSLQKELSPCDDFNNSLIDLSQLVVEKRGKTQLAFVGDVTLDEDLDDLEYKVDIFIDKNTNWEYLVTYEDKDLCKHIMDEDQIWTPFVKEMGISGCPIKNNTYSFKESMLDMSKYSLSAKNAGLYRGTVYLLQGGEKISCHFADIDIST